MATANTKPKTAKPAFSVDMVRTYLHEIGRVPLLTHEQEIVYGKRVQQMMELFQVKESLTQISGYEPTHPEWAQKANLSEVELNTVLEQGQRAKQKMIEGNLRLVVSVAKKYQKRNLELLDLVQEGTLGLERGVEKFDPTRGYKFSTYAYWWIRQAITRAIAQQARTIRLPIHITEKLNKIKKAQRILSQQLGRSATPAEIAQELDLPTTQIREYLTLARQPVSLDLRVGDNQDTELRDLLEDDGPSPEQYTVGEALRDDIHGMLDELTAQQREVLTLRFGLDNGQELSLAKVGQQLNLSRERVRQLERQALDHLRRHQFNSREYLAS